MYTDVEEILSACLYLHVSFYSGVEFIQNYAQPQHWQNSNIKKETIPTNIQVTPAV
jgi:hypothetical protein